MQESTERAARGAAPNALALPGGQRKVAKRRQQHGAVALHVDELDGVDISEREQEGADGGGGHRQGEVAVGQPHEAEEADGAERRHRQHQGAERVEAEPKEPRVDDADEEEGIGVAERAGLGKEETRVGPTHRAGENVLPVMDQRERDFPIAVVPEHAVEAGEQPAAEQKHETGREQHGRQPADGKLTKPGYPIALRD